MEENLLVSIPEAAAALGMDSNTVRLLIRQGVFRWGKCFKQPGNKKYTYLIYRKDFCEQTGYKI